MLTIYETRWGALEPHKNPRRIVEHTVWIDLLNPKREQEAKVERALKIDVPTREEQQEIEVSSCLYQEDGAHFIDRHGAVSDRDGRASDHADYLHPCRQQAHHLSLRRAARLLNLYCTLPQT
jgi:Mg2+ and Co2+ transporter CorA